MWKLKNGGEIKFISLEEPERYQSVDFGEITTDAVEDDPISEDTEFNQDDADYEEDYDKKHRKGEWE